MTSSNNKSNNNSGNVDNGDDSKYNGNPVEKSNIKVMNETVMNKVTDKRSEVIVVSTPKLRRSSRNTSALRKNMNLESMPNNGLEYHDIPGPVSEVGENYVNTYDANNNNNDDSSFKDSESNNEYENVNENEAESEINNSDSGIYNETNGTTKMGGEPQRNRRESRFITLPFPEVNTQFMSAKRTNEGVGKEYLIKAKIARKGNIDSVWGDLQYHTKEIVCCAYDSKTNGNESNVISLRALTSAQIKDLATKIEKATEHIGDIPISKVADQQFSIWLVIRGWRYKRDGVIARLKRHQL
ncbi:hypothetical protein H4219_003221 [Mycoemilia scoparia]|uniref:Uncharacterized protein n=1 Tax=Mycoemilia scoparia TaxID=417184 RepID=A0A9W8A4S5_9FUNG|nr:hypothetical protein H4219_003221 [Mycoemilia scoparia]